MYYFYVFFIYSIFGFIFETLFIKGTFNSGILYGPWTPVYGIGAVVIILIHKFLDKHVKSSVLRGILLFFLSALVLTGLEWLGGMLIEVIFNKVYWSYENLKFNFGHYIALEVSAIWGIVSIILIYLVKPIIDKFIKNFPKWITYILLTLFLLDLVVTLIIK